MRKTVFLLSGATDMEEWCELRLKTDGKFRLLAEGIGGRESRQVRK